MKAVNIMWDTDGDKEIFNELPKEIELPQDIDADEIGDYLSDETGYCHFGYQLEESYYGEFKDKVINAIRETAGEYHRWGEHKTLISFCDLLVNHMDLAIEDENNLPDVLDELENTQFIVIVEKDWLFDLMKADGISDPQYYLENEYDGDDSMEWFTQAAALGKIAALVF